MLFAFLLVSSMSLGGVFGKPAIGARAEAPKEAVTLNVEDETAEDGVFLKQYYMTEYFSNLTSHFGYNDYGTCAHVAIEMMLTYYDTYWDDNIVPTNFEQSITFDYEENNDGEPVISLGQTSPGSLTESSQSNVYDDWRPYYEDLVVPNSQNSLHYFLLTLDEPNSLLGDLFGYPWISSCEDWAYTCRKYLFTERGYSQSDFTIDQNVDEYGFSLPPEQFIINHLKQGIPCFAIIDDGLFNQHTLVAYDYDEATDTIYFHSGYYEGNQFHNEVTKICYDFTKGNEKFYKNINTAMTFYPNYARKETNNFKYSDAGVEKYASMENLAVASEITMEGGANSEPPTFKIENPYWVGQGLNKQYSGHLEFYDYMEGISLITSIDENGVATLRMSDWEQIMKLPHDHFYACISLNEGNSIGEYRGLLQRFEDPKPYEDILHLDAEDFGFASQYYFEEKNNSIALRNWFTVTTSRLRCGYIEDSFINLSPRREGAGESYLELTWNIPIYTIQIGIALWNEEYYVTEESEAFIEVQDQAGNWEQECDLLNEIQTGLLRAKRYGFSRKRFSDQDGIWGIRIVNNSEAVGDRNLNRISIDQIVFADTYGQVLQYDNY